jgi:hypothetical protein
MRREIQDRQAAVPEREVRAVVVTVAVGTPVCDQVREALDGTAFDRRVSFIDYSADTAHR